MSLTHSIERYTDFHTVHHIFASFFLESFIKLTIFEMTCPVSGGSLNSALFFATVEHLTA